MSKNLKVGKWISRSFWAIRLHPESILEIQVLRRFFYQMIIDEQKGRRIASSQGIKIIGSLGILLLAKQNGLIGPLKPFLDLLRNTDIRISTALYQSILKMAGESTTSP
jgi:predicted nucleic acid-binding protein